MDVKIGVDLGLCRAEHCVLRGFLVGNQSCGMQIAFELELFVNWEGIELEIGMDVVWKLGWILVWKLGWKLCWILVWKLGWMFLDCIFDSSQFESYELWQDCCFGFCWDGKKISLCRNILIFIWRLN